MIYIVYEMTIKEMVGNVTFQQTNAQINELRNLMDMLGEDKIAKYIGIRELAIVKLRLDLMSYDGIGQIYGITRERIRQVVQNTLAKLRFLIKREVPDLVITEVPITYERFLRKGEWVTYKSIYYKYEHKKN